jgi:hypothetical protein
MLTSAAARSIPDSIEHAIDTVTSSAQLRRRGWTVAAVRGHLDARRWQRVGRAIILHNGSLTPDESREVALLNCGPRAMLTAFTAAELAGLTGWERDAIHVLVPGGARITRPPGIALRVHYTGDWDAVDQLPARRLHAIASALVIASSTFESPRSACGILAAGVQQRLARAEQLDRAIRLNPRLRHRALMVHAMRDIAQGAEALSEIDFARLCRRFDLPTPVRQAVRVEPNGRRRYLDAEWRRRDGRRVVAEVDGALHLIARRWWEDQSRQNELVLTGDMLLRYPSVVVRTEQEIVADQLRRALGL